MNARLVQPTQIEAEQIKVSLNEVPILHGITMHAEPGSVVGLLGPNGSGKSTLLRTFFQSLVPDEGEIRLAEGPLSDLTARQVARRVAVVLQEMPGDFPLTALEVVKMARFPHKRALEAENEGDLAICMAALDVMQVRNLADKPFTQMSGGERQRVLIARAFAQQPEVLLMDEPTNHLDLPHQLDLFELVAELGVTTIVALHDLNLAARFCDQLALLRSGRLAAFGTPAEVLNAELVRQIYDVDAQIITHPTTGRPHVIAL